MSLAIKEISPSLYQLEGRLDLSKINSIQKKLSALSLAKKDCQIDCSQLSYCDSAGIALLVSFLAKAKKNKVKVLLTNLSEQMLKLIELMNLNVFFTDVNHAEQ